MSDAFGLFGRGGWVGSEAWWGHGGAAGARVLAPVAERVVRVTADCGQDFEAALGWNRRGAAALEWFADGGDGEWPRVKVVPVAEFLRHPRRETYWIGSQPLRPRDVADLQGWAAQLSAWGTAGGGCFAARERALWARAEAAERWLLEERRW